MNVKRVQTLRDVKCKEWSKVTFISLALGTLLRPGEVWRLTGARRWTTRRYHEPWGHIRHSHDRNGDTIYCIYYILYILSGITMAVRGKAGRDTSPWSGRWGSATGQYCIIWSEWIFAIQIFFTVILGSRTKNTSLNCGTIPEQI